MNEKAIMWIYEKVKGKSKNIKESCGSSKSEKISHKLWIYTKKWKWKLVYNCVYKLCIIVNTRKWKSKSSRESADRAGTTKVRQCSRQPGNGIKTLILYNTKHKIQKCWKYRYSANTNIYEECSHAPRHKFTINSQKRISASSEVRKNYTAGSIHPKFGFVRQHFWLKIKNVKFLTLNTRFTHFLRPFHNYFNWRNSFLINNAERCS